MISCGSIKVKLWVANEPVTDRGLSCFGGSEAVLWRGCVRRFDIAVELKETRCPRRGREVGGITEKRSVHDVESNAEFLDRHRWRIRLRRVERKDDSSSRRWCNV